VEAVPESKGMETTADILQSVHLATLSPEDQRKYFRVGASCVSRAGCPWPPCLEELGSCNLKCDILINGMRTDCGLLEFGAGCG